MKENKIYALYIEMSEMMDKMPVGLGGEGLEGMYHKEAMGGNESMKPETMMSGGKRRRRRKSAKRKTAKKGGKRYKRKTAKKGGKRRKSGKKRH